MGEFSLDLLRTALERFSGVEYAELRLHSRTLNEVRVRRGEVEEARSVVYEGVGARVIADGAWGFSSTGRLTPEALAEALREAAAIARISAKARRSKVKLADAKLAVGKFQPQTRDPLENHPLEEKVKLALEAEAAARRRSPLIVSASCSYREYLDRKLIATTDGAAAEVFDPKPEFKLSVTAKGRGNMVSASDGVGATGGWGDLFAERGPEQIAQAAAERAVRLLDAGQPKGGRAVVILHPTLVDLLAHEAIGHTVEADFVQSGSVAAGKLGQRLASELVTLVDSGPSPVRPNAAGTTLVDDEGVLAGRTVILDRGVLVSYLHNRQTAAQMGAEPTGNARAYEYSDEPLIRMRNTYIEPGDYSLEEMVEEVDTGYLLMGFGGGQADANGEFMFRVQEARLIEKGELGPVFRETAVSGQAFEVLATVDAVSREFAFTGLGHCGKGQPIKVDGGGPYLRCRAIIGGSQ